MSDWWKAGGQDDPAPRRADAPLGGGTTAPGQGAEPEPRGGPRIARLVVGGVVLAVLVWFAFANLQGVPIHFWVVTRTAPLIVVVAISGALGAAAAVTWTRVRRRRAERAR